MHQNRSLTLSFFLRGLNGAGAEIALAVLAYNFRRALNLLGASAMRQRLVLVGA